jgi:hypothetical protein
MQEQLAANALSAGIAINAALLKITPLSSSQ